MLILRTGRIEKALVAIWKESTLGLPRTCGLKLEEDYQPSMTSERQFRS